MKNKIVLVLVDGMRPDGVEKCGHPYAKTLQSLSSWSMTAQTVMPSVTLPCHMSLFHSVNPDRHGVTTNTYVPQVRPIEGLFDRLDKFEKKCAFFNTWEELRDLSRPDHLHTYVCLNQHKQSDTDTKITRLAIDYIQKEDPDFTFIYLGETDEVGGHSVGWMSDTYLGCINNAFECIQKLHESLPENYTLIVTADHGGHDRSHGTDLPEDMTIPLFLSGPSFEKNKALENVSIKDVAPTIAKLLGVSPAKEWEGKALL
ncbi:MAG: alkaline phosphatase family protein [Clostridia bacterium]|nr:alkaline phosphatase family protein [Clostridia bacterium]